MLLTVRGGSPEGDSVIGNRHEESGEDAVAAADSCTCGLNDEFGEGREGAAANGRTLTGSLYVRAGTGGRGGGAIGA